MAIFFPEGKTTSAPVYTAVSAPVIWLCGRRDSKKKLEHRDKQKRGRDSQKKKADAKAKRTRHRNGKNEIIAGAETVKKKPRGAAHIQFRGFASANQVTCPSGSGSGVRAKPLRSAPIPAVHNLSVACFFLEIFLSKKHRVGP
jgi:hypothetical protein